MTTQPLVYDHYGAGDERIVLCHGAGQSARSWQTVAPHLAEHFEVVVPDLPYHGRSANSDATNLADAAVALADTFGAAVYVGYFLGGRMCMQLALDRPDLIRGLVLLGSITGIDDDAQRAQRRAEEEAMATSLEEATPEEAYAIYERRVSNGLSHPDFLLDAEQHKREYESRMVTKPLDYAKIMRYFGSGAEPGYTSRLSELQMPVLLVAGGHDARFQRAMQEVAAGIGANAEIATIVGAGHPAPCEAPQQFAEVVAKWVSSAC